MIRPDLIGNERVLARVERMLETDRLPHALILEGPEGSGRRTLARYIAQAAACTGEHRPCGACAACRLGEHNPDITELSVDKTVIPVDAVRQLRSDAYIKATRSAGRVFILPDAQRMNPQAQNALLKVLEEPPTGGLFLLTCGHARQLLDTVLSRAAVLSLVPPEREDMIGYLLRTHPEYTPSQIESALAGTVGKTLERLSGAVGYEELAKEAAAALTGEEWKLHRLLRPIEKDRPAQKGLSRAMSVLFHDALAVRMGAPRGTQEEMAGLLARRWTPEQLLKLAEVCETAQADADSSLGGGLFVAVFCARLFRAVRE